MAEHGEHQECGSELDVVWGAHGIGLAINRTPRQVHYLISTGALPVKKVGKLWCINRATLKNFFDGANVKRSAA